MQSARETAARFGETISQKATGKPSTSSQKAPQIPDWNIEEKLETTVDKDGNAVPDAFSFTDGAKMMRGGQEPDEADPHIAATADFD